MILGKLFIYLQGLISTMRKKTTIKKYCKCQWCNDYFETSKAAKFCSNSCRTMKSRKDNEK